MTTTERVEDLRRQASEKWAEASRLQREHYLLQAEADALAGDHASAEFHRALGTEGADTTAAYIRLRATEYLRHGQHWVSEPDIHRAEIERVAAEMKAKEAAHAA